MRAERDALLAEIELAFEGVTREGGVSWSETEVLDNCGTPAECAAARALDKDMSWKVVALNPGWEKDPVVGSWSFLDPIGFRYYLPAAMVYSVKVDENQDFLYHLNPGDDSLTQHRIQKWSLLTHRQRLCVKRYLEYMGVYGAFQRAEKSVDRKYVSALRDYWGKLECSD